MKGAIWRIEWTLALRRRRLFWLNAGIPLVLVLPLVLGGAPVFHAAAALSVLFVLFGTFGSAIPLVREGEGGVLRRILLAGVPESRLLLERVLAGAALDAVQLLPSLAVILLAWGAGGETWLLAGPVFLLTLLAANLVGVWVAAAARSLAEGALFAAVISLFLLHGSGVFRTPAPGSVGSALATLLPFGPLHRILLDTGGVAPPPGPAWSLLAPGGFAVGLLLLTLRLAPVLMRRIAPAAR